MKALRSREESSRPGRARRWSSSSTRPRRITERTQGHRQPYTLVEITAVDGEKAPAAPAEAKAETAKSEEVKEAADSAVKPAKKPSLKSMRKAELIEFAKENNIEIDEKATNAVMIETIEAALK